MQRSATRWRARAHLFLCFGRVARCGPHAPRAGVRRARVWRANGAARVRLQQFSVPVGTVHLIRSAFSLMIRRLTVWVCSVERGRALSNIAEGHIKLTVCNARASTGMRIILGFMVDGQV